MIRKEKERILLRTPYYSYVGCYEHLRPWAEDTYHSKSKDQSCDVLVITATADPLLGSAQGASDPRSFFPPAEDASRERSRASGPLLAVFSIPVPVGEAGGESLGQRGASRRVEEGDDMFER